MFGHSFDVWKVKEIGGCLTLHCGVGWCQSASQVVLHYRFGIAVASEHLSEVLDHYTTPQSTLAVCTVYIYAIDCDCFCMHPAVVHMSIHISTSLSFFSFISPLVAVQYEQERYSVAEEDGSVTLALVLDRVVPFPVTVIVSTMDLLNSSVGDAATGELLELY